MKETASGALAYSLQALCRQGRKPTPGMEEVMENSSASGLFPREDDRSRVGPANLSADYTINARVMQILTRRWVTLSTVEVGTTDGVVLIKGALEREPGGWEEADDLSRQRFLHSLRTAVRGIPGVVDVVMELNAPEGEAPRIHGAG
jgi:hypothetical protein